MTAELIELTKEFHLGNRFTLETAEQLANKLDERFRIIVKYDQPEELPRYNDNKLNIIFSTSRETHNRPLDFYREDVFAIFQHYFMLDEWGHPIFNPIVYPAPLGPFVDIKDEEIIPIPEREYDFCFIGQIPHTGTRDYFKRNLDNLVEETGEKFKYYIKYTDGFSKGLEPKEYLEILGNSKLSLCPQGANSLETFRFFESLMMGAIPICERLPRVWYYEKSPHFTVRWSEIDNNISQVLNFLQSPQARDVFYGVAHYCGEILNPEKLADHFKEKLGNRLANPHLDKYNVEKARKELPILDGAIHV